jgi:phosphatidylserine/phosphatidylglycerophosphate/cardiolipin synthase-like enzyme
MKGYVFVGWSLREAQTEAVRRGIKVQSIIPTTPPRQTGEEGIPYVIQERWRDEKAVSWVVGRRLLGKEVYSNGLYD